MSYRHRVTIEQPTRGRDASGNAVVTWSTFAADIPAKWLPGPGREYLAAEATRQQTVGRLALRYLPGVTAAMRVQFDGKTYRITAAPMGDATGRRETILMVGSDE